MVSWLALALRCGHTAEVRSLWCSLYLVSSGHAALAKHGPCRRSAFGSSIFASCAAQDMEADRFLKSLIRCWVLIYRNLSIISKIGAARTCRASSMVAGRGSRREGDEPAAV